MEFLLAGDKLAAAFLVTRTTALDFRAAIRLLMEIEAKLGEVIESGFKIMAEGKKTN